jgi:hypothetical protein
MAEWLASYRQLQAKQTDERNPSLSTNELILAYWDYAKSYYCKNGQPTSQLGLVKLAMRPLSDIYGTLPVSTLGPLSLKTVRQRMIDDGISLSVVNKFVGIIKRMFKWTAENEFVAASVYHGLQTVSGLRRGRSEARDTSPIGPVPEARVRAIFPYLSRQVCAMVQLQLLTGMRPGEVVAMLG